MRHLTSKCVIDAISRPVLNTELDIIIQKKAYAEGLYLNMYMCLKFQGHFIIIDQFYLIFTVDVFRFQYYLVLLGILY